MISIYIHRIQYMHCSSQSELTLLKIRKSSAHALTLYSVTQNNSCRVDSFAKWVIVFFWQYLMMFYAR